MKKIKVELTPDELESAIEATLYAIEATLYAVELFRNNKMSKSSLDRYRALFHKLNGIAGDE